MTSIPSITIQVKGNGMTRAQWMQHIINNPSPSMLREVERNQVSEYGPGTFTPDTEHWVFISDYTTEERLEEYRLFAEAHPIDVKMAVKVEAAYNRTPENRLVVMFCYSTSAALLFKLANG